MKQLARKAMRKQRSRPIRRPVQTAHFVRPRLEELESRTLLSASAVPTPAAQSSSNPVMQPAFTAQPLATSGSTYYVPSQVRTAYGVSTATLPNGQSATGAGQTIAIVDAYVDPNITSDLAKFDAQVGLAAPPSFQVVKLNGASVVDANWASETALDVEWAHAIAPQANILLVEAPSASLSDLMAAVQYAASQPGVVAVSMSWGGGEFSGETSYDSTFTTPSGHIGGSNLPGGVTFVASSGDNGVWYGALWPAISPNVLAVGGTSLHLTSSNTYSSEKAWSGSGGGYSSFESEPAFQQSVQHTGVRTNPDVAYNADPNTGYLIYDSVGLQAGQSGWWIAGGTSAGAPQWAAIIALADQARAVNGLGSLGNGQVAIYNLSRSDFHDVTSGSNGYRAGTGYDLATGLGTPYANKIVHDLASAPNPVSLASINSGTGGGALSHHASLTPVNPPTTTSNVPAPVTHQPASPTPSTVAPTDVLFLPLLMDALLPHFAAATAHAENFLAVPSFNLLATLTTSSVNSETAVTLPTASTIVTTEGTAGTSLGVTFRQPPETPWSTTVGYGSPVNDSEDVVADGKGAGGADAPQVPAQLGDPDATDMEWTDDVAGIDV